MASVLKYGNRHAFELDVPADRLVAEFHAPPGTAICEPASAVAERLKNPVDFPPLSRATVPGDRVAVALDPSVPRPSAIVAGLVRTLLDCNIRPADIAIVQPAAERQRLDPRRELSPEVAKEVRWEVHDPRDRKQLSYLGVSAAGRGVYLNRTLCEAEFAVPINSVRPTRSLGPHGKHTCLFPTFSNQETIDRFRQPGDSHGPTDRQPSTDEADEAGWLLGIVMAINAVPDAAGQVLHVLPGEVGAVYRQGQSLADAAWEFPVPQRASLVVASIASTDEEPTWFDVARGLAAASAVMTDDGATVICTDLKSSPGPALRRIGDAEDLDVALAEACRDTSTDASAAAELVRALMRGRVYLMSDVDADLVEQTGMAPVSTATELGRLARRHESCIVLNHAQFVAPMALDDDPASDDQE